MLCVNGNILSVYDTDFNQNIGRMMYRIALNEIKEVESSSFVLRRYLKFIYENRIYHFGDFGDAKRFNALILEEAGKK